jgi:serine/threonine protein kinase
LSEERGNKRKREHGKFPDTLLEQEALKPVAAGAAPGSWTPQAAPVTGTILAQQFEVLETLGVGGMGTVYKCVDLLTKRVVAVKILRQELASDEKALIRFQREAQAIASFEHPHLIKLYSFQVSPVPMLIMEFLDGVSLDKVLQKSGALTEDQTRELAIQICDALHYAHTLGVVHRDLKPSNIILEGAGSRGQRAKVVDFGIAKIADAKSNATATGELFGSPAYMSPEQVQGLAVSDRADQYSLGCVLFECLTGCKPFINEAPFAVMMAHVNSQPPTLKEASLGKTFSHQIQSVVARMMEKDPERRFSSMATARDAIARDVSAEPARPPRVQAKPSNRKMLIWGGVAVTACVLWVGVIVMGAGFGMFGGSKPAAQNSDTAGSSKLSAADASLPDAGANANIEDTMGAVNESDSREFIVALKHPGSVIDPMKNEKIDRELVEHLNKTKTVEIVHLKARTNTKMLSQVKNTSVTELVLDDSDIDTATLAKLSGFKSLKKLSLNGCTELREKGFGDAVLQLKGLKQLQLSQASVGNSAFAALRKHKTLEEIYLQQNPLDTETISDLGKVPALVRLDLRHMQALTGTLGALKHAPKLANLEILDSPLTEQDLDDITQCKHLIVLALNWQRIRPEKYLEMIQKLPHLRETGAASHYPADINSRAEKILKSHSRI